jgi:ATP-dependent helicase/nuclease subunit A
MTLTAAQQEAIAARGNVLVVAGAGTGKTKTLVERCLNCLLQEAPVASLDEILMVTFTEAAAAEMRQRIRERLEKELERDPKNSHLREQQALFEMAAIGTLHSFCLQLIRQHFYELELDPQLAVLPQEEGQVLAEETLDQLFEGYYGGRGALAEAVQRLIQSQGGGSDDLIRSLVLKLHHYTQTRPDPAGWLSRQLAMFASPEPLQWREWLPQAIDDWRQRWLPVLERMAAENGIAAKCAAALQELQDRQTTDDGPRTTQHATGSTIGQSLLASAATTFEDIAAACKDCPRGKKGLWLDPLEEFREEADFLASLLATAGEADPLAQDWDWVRGEMTTLLTLAREFTVKFTEAKHELGMVDFHDLEQFALRLLWDHNSDQPTPIARQWREKLRFIFVDEYQDINAAQDKIIEAISRAGAQANRFLVGDVKQSIYRFRLADPHIFQGYVEAWGNGCQLQVESSRLGSSASEQLATCNLQPATSSPTRVIPLADNFRSREGILDFLNSLFALLIRPEIGGVTYDELARLRFGAPEERQALGAQANGGLCVELHLRTRASRNDKGSDEEPSEEMAPVLDLQDSDKEARIIALRLRALKNERHPVWDEAAKAFRAVEWSDMAILLRSPANKAESYAKEFSRLNVPLLVERGGFYESLEINDLLSLLQTLDNPLQDIPVLAVLHSPLVGLTLAELATIRLTIPKAPFWKALVLSAEPANEGRNPKSEIRNPNPGRRQHSSETANTQHATRNPDHAPRSTLHAPLLTDPETHRKITAFLTRFARWRRLARQVSLSHCLEAVLAETHYADWLLTQSRGEQRHANVQRLVTLARQFDRFQRQGLFRFLRFIEAQKRAETEPEISAVSDENSVRLMSIHQSKGLEFPVVVVADLGKRFNFKDLHAEMILDEAYGLCAQIKPPHTGKRYPSLPYWLARQRQKLELLGEELRLLYVAMTRARDLLLLSATVSDPSKYSSSRRKEAHAEKSEIRNPKSEIGQCLLTSAPTRESLLSARSCADWVALWLAQQPTTAAEGATQGENTFLWWNIHEDCELTEPPVTTRDDADESAALIEPAAWQALQQRLSGQYPFASATCQPAKTSVSILRRAAEARDHDAEAGDLFATRNPPLMPHASRLTRHAASLLTGSAHHKFLQLVALDRTDSLEALRREATRLREEKALTEEELALLDLKGLAAFWQSELGCKVRTQARFVQRELAFTARFSPPELAALIGAPPEPGLGEEFVVVQGVADLVAVLPEEIWLVDFKTDALEPQELADKVSLYEPQLKLYAQALAQIYRRPVSECWLYFLAAQKALAIAASER